MQKRVVVLMLAFIAVSVVFGSEPVTFANPLDLDYRVRPEKNMKFREGADPEIVVWENRYWLFASKCGGYYVSDDLATWEFIATSDLPLEEYAPTAWVMNGKLYFSSRGGTVHRAIDAAAGKWELLKERVPYTLDSKVFFKDGRLYNYWGGTTNQVPLWVCELNPETFRRVGKNVPVCEMDDGRFGWDVRGDGNDLFDRPGYKEGASMVERDGRYYFQYATPGTQFHSYCDVALTAPSPTGPFTRQKINPFSIKPCGYVKGAGHGGTFRDLHGNWWHVTTCVISGVERRIVLFPVFFTRDGEMWCDTSSADWPIAVPKCRSTDPEDFRSHWMPLTFGKAVSVSSTAPGTDKSRLTDENMRFCWSAKTGSRGEWARVDLGGVAEIRAVQIAFADAGDIEAWRAVGAFRRWRLEVSEDGRTWRTAVDESSAKNDADHCYRVLPEPVRASALRVVCEGVPAGALFALREIRAFGRMGSVVPSVPGRPLVVRDAEDRRIARISWSVADGAEGYLLRYGPSRDKMHISLMVRGACEAQVRSLDARHEYVWAVEAFNAAGRSALSESVQK